MIKTCDTHGEYEALEIDLPSLCKTITFGCPKCQAERDARLEAEEKAEELRKDQERIVLWQNLAKIPQRYRTVFTHAPKPNQKLRQWNGRDNIICIGGVGGGKTHYISYIGNTCILNKRTVRYVMMNEIEGRIKGAWGSKVITEDTVINDFIDCEVLIIDEIGRGSYTEYLFRIFDGRYNNQKPTIIAGNVTADEVKTILGDAIVSRLKGHGVVVNSFEAEDLRLI